MAKHPVPTNKLDIRDEIRYGVPMDVCPTCREVILVDDNADPFTRPECPICKGEDK